MNNTEEVYFCEDCLSLAIVWDETEQFYVCKDCGSIVQIKSSFEVWQEKFANKYQKDYLCISKGEFKGLIDLL